MQDIISVIEWIVTFICSLVIIGGAIWGVYRYNKKRNLILDVESPTHWCNGGRFQFEFNLSIENNQQREIPLTSNRLFYKGIELQFVPRNFELENTRLASGDRREIAYTFMQLEGDPFLFGPRVKLKIVIGWNGSTTSKKFVSLIRV